MNIQLLALILLIGRLISEFFIVMVLRKQWQLRKTRTHPRLLTIRKVLTLLAALVFLGNIFPLLLDAYTLFYPGIRTSPMVNPIGVLYSLDNSLTAMLASILIWTLYKLSDVVIEVAELVTGKPIITTTPKPKTVI